MSNNKVYMTVDEFAEKQGIHRKTVYDWIKSGKAIKKKLGSATFVSLA
jgi:excisionase family DNA binding protein